jgi:lipid-binding SYLF domain-containing protein
MPGYARARLAVLLLAVLVTILMSRAPAMAADAAEIDRDASAALALLYQTTPAAEQLAPRAKAILIFPSIVKAGFLVGAQYGDGALRRGGRTVAYYRMTAASYGLQAGVQSFGYAMFLMTDAAVAYLNESRGWEIGVGPSIVIVDEGMGKTLTTTTAKDDVYGFIFGQKGLMAGLGVQGSKITQIDP